MSTAEARWENTDIAKSLMPLPIVPRQTRNCKLRDGQNTLDHSSAANQFRLISCKPTVVNSLKFSVFEINKKIGIGSGPHISVLKEKKSVLWCPAPWSFHPFTYYPIDVHEWDLDWEVKSENEITASPCAPCDTMTQLTDSPNHCHNMSFNKTLIQLDAT